MSTEPELLNALFTLGYIASHFLIFFAAAKYGGQR